MYEEDLDAKTPPDETIIWRYMSLDKYIDLLYRKELFLCRLDKLIDPWEGSWSKQEIEESPYKEDDLKGPDGLIQEFKRWSFINCWHINKHESAAMWDLYSSRNAGIAIKTTIGKLKDSLKEDSKRLHIGEIQYVDNYDDNIEQSRDLNYLTMLGPVFKKRQSFIHENEVRLVFWTTERTSFSYAKVDLGKIIDRIYLSPTMEDWLVESIKGISEKFNIKSNLFEKSDLYSQYVY